MKTFYNKAGQNALEYILVFTAVLVVLIVLLSPRSSGLIRDRVDDSLNLSMEALECMAASFCYKKGGCGEKCGDGCCQPGEGGAGGTCLSDC